MQASSSFSLSCNFSFPLCVSGITRRLTLSYEMVDHDRRRRAMKRQRSVGRSVDFRPGEIRRGDDEISFTRSGDAGGLRRSKVCNGLLFAAKAA